MDDRREEETLLTWTSCPARDQPRAALLTVVYAAAVALAVHLYFGSPWLTALGGLVVLGGAAEFLLPSTYTLTSAGAERHGWIGRQRLAWGEVKAVFVRPDGVQLSPLVAPRRLEAHRLLFLRCGQRQEEVLALIDRLATARRRPESLDG